MRNFITTLQVMGTFRNFRSGQWKIHSFDSGILYLVKGNTFKTLT